MNQGNNVFGYPEGPAVSDRMRELLARAAQDQATEQRTHTAAIEEIRQRLEGLEWLVQRVREHEIAGFAKALGSVRDQVEGLNTKPPQWAETLAVHVDEVGERVKPIGELPEVRHDVGGIAETVDELLGKLQPIVDRTQQTAARIEEIGSRVEQLQAGMDTAGTRFTRIEKVLTELSERLTRLDATAGGAADRVDEGLAEVARSSENVASRLQALDGRLEGLHGRLGGLEGRIEGFDGRLVAVSDRVEGLPGALDAADIHRRLADLTQRPVVDSAAWLESVDERLTRATEKLGAELRSRPDREEFADTLSKVFEAVHADWSRRLGSLEETMLALAEALLRPLQPPAASPEPTAERRPEHKQQARQHKPRGDQPGGQR